MTRQNGTKMNALELNTIYTGDCARVLATFPEACIDLTVTSPPYDNLRTYNGYVFDFQAIAKQLYRVTKPGGVVVWVVGDATINGSETGTSFRQALYFMECGFGLYDTMYFYRFNGIPIEGRYYDVIEYMFVFCRGCRPNTINFLKDKINVQAGQKKQRQTSINHGRSKNGEGKFVVAENGRRTNVWDYPLGQDGQRIHPAPFPEALARDHILSWSNPGDVVLDPMAGSGTTLKMAMQLERKYVGIEISPEYVQLIKRRLAASNVPLPMFSEATK